MTIRQESAMGLFHGGSSLYSGRRGLYAGPKRHGGGFSPAQLPGLLAWYDPSLGEGVGYTLENGDVDQIVDQHTAGPYHLTNATVSERPAVGATINGLTTIGFNIAASVNESMESTTIPLGPSQCFAFVAERKDDDVAGGDRKLIGNGAFASTFSGFRILAEDNTSGTFRRISFEVADGISKDALRSANDAIRTDTPLVILAQYDGSNMVLNVAGVEVSLASTLDPSKTGDFAFGNERIGNTQFEFIGNCAELVVCNALNVESRTELVDYLSSKWLL